MSLARMLSFTIYMAPVHAFGFLLGMCVVTATRGDITSVVFGVPLPRRPPCSVAVY